MFSVSEIRSTEAKKVFESCWIFRFSHLFKTLRGQRFDFCQSFLPKSRETFSVRKFNFSQKIFTFLEERCQFSIPFPKESFDLILDSCLDKELHILSLLKILLAKIY